MTLPDDFWTPVRPRDPVPTTHDLRRRDYLRELDHGNLPLCLNKRVPFIAPLLYLWKPRRVLFGTPAGCDRDMGLPRSTSGADPDRV